MRSFNRAYPLHLDLEQEEADRCSDSVIECIGDALDDELSIERGVDSEEAPRASEDTLCEQQHEHFRLFDGFYQLLGGDTVQCPSVDLPCSTHQRKR